MKSFPLSGKAHSRGSDWLLRIISTFSQCPHSFPNTTLLMSSHDICFAAKVRAINLFALKPGVIAEPSMPDPDRVVGVIGQRGVAARIPEKITKRRTAEDYGQEEHDPQQTFPELFEWNEFHRLLDSMICEKNVSVQFRVRYKFRLVHGVADGIF